jgi:hypothetical protein
MYRFKSSAVVVPSPAYNQKEQGDRHDAAIFDSQDGSLGGLRDAKSAGIAAESSPRSNADVLAKVLLDIKLMLDIERVAEELDLEMPRKRRPVHDQILKIIDEAGAVGAAERIKRGFRGLRVVE